MTDIRSVADLARETRNRGSVHIFLGHPLADLCDKTTVEPGNTYSPGVWTCGVSVWLVVDGQPYTPDLLPADDIGWGFGADGGLPPVLSSTYSAGNVAVQHALCHLGAEGAEGVDFNRVTLESPVEQEISACIVVQEVGPAGGRIRGFEWDEGAKTLVVNGAMRLTVEAPDVAYRTFGGDSPLSVLYATVKLEPSTVAEVRFKTEHGFDDRPFAAAVPKKRPYRGLSVRRAFERAAEAWQRELPGRVFAPDPRIARTWETCAYHILAAMEAGLPRIGAVDYPVFWIRDGVIVLRALDLIGRHDLARRGNDYLAPLLFAGGLGAESDAPGEGIWALVSHARITRDTAWLGQAFPTIADRVRWLERMLAATEPLRALTENRAPAALNSPGVNILCLPAQNGCIHGRMDHHSPDFYINCWAIAGFRQAAWAADQLGEGVLAQAWRHRAAELERAVAAHLLPEYGNEHDPIIAPYPTEALGAQRELLLGKFRDWYAQHRLTVDGERVREPLWTYFEAAQIHNALLLGLRDWAWINLDGMLEDGQWPVCAYVEGPASGNETLRFRNDIGRRGWLSDQAAGGNMPHNWTSAEMVNLIRTIFVCEEGGGLVLGRGVPAAWLTPGSRFGVRGLPTDFGPVTYTVTVGDDGSPEMHYEGAGNYRVGW